MIRLTLPRLRSRFVTRIMLVGVTLSCTWSFRDARAELPPIIPRVSLFGNPDKADPQLSPDGTRLAYLAPDEGVLNVWVRTIGRRDDRDQEGPKNDGEHLPRALPTLPLRRLAHAFSSLHPPCTGGSQVSRQDCI